MPQMAVRSYKGLVRRATILAPGYTLSNLLKVEPHIDTCLQLLKARLDELSLKRKPVKFEEWFNFLALDVIGEALFSQSLDFLKAGKDIGNSIANTVYFRIYISILAQFPWAHDLLLANPLIEYFKLTPALHVFDTCLRVVEARSKNNEVRNDMLAQWRSQMFKHPDRMPEKDILSNAAGNLGAGSDTVASVLQALIYHLIRNTEILNILQEELDTAELSEIPSWEETKHLPILQACIKETLRIHSPVGFNLPRIAPPSGITICGRHFRSGTILSVNAWAMHYSPAFFGTDAAVFDPRRWLDPERASHMDKFMMPFGAGYNMCPGRNLAMLEVSKTAALVVRNWDIQLVDETKKWRYETYFTVAPWGWPCWLRKR